MAKLSLMARLHWPHLFLLCNAYGRFEISYPQIISRAYATFPQVPSKDEIHTYIREYHSAYLLFLYQAKGAVWGQWITDEKNLPDYKDRKSKASPVPPAAELLAWKEEYEVSKRLNIGTSVGSGLLQNLRQKNTENAYGKGYVYGKGEGMGDLSENPSRESLDPTEPEDFPEARGNSLNLAEPVKSADAGGDRWRNYIGIFIAAGKGLNDRDLEKALRIWIGMTETEQDTAAHDALCRVKNGSWPDAERTQFPVNHLRDKPWTRVALPRSIPTPQKGDREAEESLRHLREKRSRRADAPQ